MPQESPRTVEDLIIDRARGIDAMEDILRAVDARPEGERTLTDAERADYDYLAAEVADRQNAIERFAVDASHDVRRSEFDVVRSWTPPAVPNVNRMSTPSATADRSLDELLWASPEVVRAGSLDKTGQFRQHATATNTVEQTIVRSADGEYVPAPRITEFMPEHREVVRSFQQTVAEMCLFGLMVDKSAHSSSDGFQVARSHPKFASRWANICRAMDVDTSAEGGTWVPTGIGSNLHEKVRAMGKVAPLFARINIPTNPWKFPIEGADATAYRVGEPTGDTESKMTASTPGTVAATFDAEIFGARALFSRSLDADSAMAILPYVTRKLVLAFVSAEERAILDGDTDGTHQDSDTNTAGATDAAWAWDGLRKKAIAQTVVTATSTTAANLIAIRGGMGKWGVNPAELAYIVGVSAYLDLIGDTNLLTVDKMGPNATILNGMVGSVAGVPVIVSEYVRENLNASGVYDAITTTKTYNLCVNRSEWAMGQRMALDVEVDDSIYRETFQRVAVAFMREDFQHIGDAATNEDTAIAYNVTP